MFGERAVHREFWTPLHRAVHDGLESAVETILRECPGALLGYTPYYGTALHIAAKQGHASIVRMLLARLPARPCENKIVDMTDQFHWTALHYAASEGHVAVVETLLAVKPQLEDVHGGWNSNPMHLAVANGHTKVVELLLAAGMDPCKQDVNRKSSLCIAARHGWKDIVEVLLASGKVTGQVLRAFEHALWEDHIEIADLLLAANPAVIHEVNSENFSVLHFAAEHGKYNIVERLLGVDPSWADAVVLNERTTAHLAAEGCSEGHDKTMQVLLAVNPKLVEKVDRNSNTVLHAAASKGSKVQVEMLLARIPHLIFARNFLQWTALDCAIDRGALDIVRMLLHAENEATKSLPTPCEALHLQAKATERSRIALHLACRTGQQEMAALLLSERPQLVTVVDDEQNFVLHYAPCCGVDFAEQVRAAYPEALHAVNRLGDMPLRSENGKLFNLWQGKLFIEELVRFMHEGVPRALKRFVGEPLEVHLNKDLVKLVLALLVDSSIWKRKLLTE